MKMEPFKRPCSLRWQCWPSCLSIHPKREPICTLLSKDFLRIVFTRCSPKKNTDGFQFDECQFFSRSLENTTPPFSEVCLVLSMFTLHLPSKKKQPKREGDRWQIFPSDVPRLRVSAAPFTFTGFVTLKMGEADGRHGVIFGESF